MLEELEGKNERGDKKEHEILSQREMLIPYTPNYSTKNLESRTRHTSQSFRYKKNTNICKCQVIQEDPTMKVDQND